MSDLLSLDCVISRSSFSGERLFRVVQVNGEPYDSVAPEHYFRKQDGSLLAPDEPALDQAIKGTVNVRRLPNGGEDVRVALPTGETISVKRSQAHPRTEMTRPRIVEPVGVSV